MITQQREVLTFEVFVAPPVRVITNDLAPGQSLRVWSPITATLIAGERDAVLVDALMTTEQGRSLADWIAASGKNLTTVYITHGHGDHWFGVSAIRERYPHARTVATPLVVEHMQQQVSPKTFGAFWESRFPGQIQRDVAVAEAVRDLRMELEGHELIPVETGHTDTEGTTVLHVPSIGLVVAGDVAYNDVHLYLAESDHDRRLEWIRALDTIDAMRPRAVVAGHKRPGLADDPKIVEETRRYIHDFDRSAEHTSSAEELYSEMLSLYPDRVNPGALWSSARGVKG
jgi:glyoxylase-like metal-dependent hydrolase (beta-lactamase superfamily II)